MSFLSVALVFLVAALIVVPVFKRLGLSSVLGYLAAGLLIGPAGLGLSDGTEGLLHFAEIGVVLLLFVIGLELQPKRFWVMRRAVFGLGTAQMIVTAAVLAAILREAVGLTLPAALLLGFSLALSSTAFVLQLLGEQKKLNRPHGRAAFGVLLLQDIAVIPAIATLNLIAQARAGEVGSVTGAIIPAVIVIAGLAAARFALRPALNFVASTGIQELFTAAALAIVVGAALAMESVHLSMGLGAFAAGMMVADSQYRHQLEADVAPFKGLLLGLFFMAVGMSVDLSLLASMPGTVCGLALALVAVKTAVAYPLARVYGLTHPESLRAAIVLSQGGEFAFVLLTSAGVLELAHAQIAVLVVTLSMATTPLLVRLGDRMLAETLPQRKFDEIDQPTRPVMIAGFDRFGQIVGRVLSMRHIPFTALEVNPTQVDFVRSYGNEIHYGDATRLDLLRAAGVAQASAFVIAVDDVDASMRIAELLRTTFPKLKILARARDRRHEIQLRELGVPFVVRDTLMSSLALTGELLHELGLTRDEARTTVDMFRSHDAATLARQAAVYKDEKAFRQTTMDAAQELSELFTEDSRSAEARTLRGDRLRDGKDGNRGGSSAGNRDRSGA